MEPLKIPSTNTIHRCDCDAPMVKQIDSRMLEIQKFNKGKSFKIIIGYEGDMCYASCKECGKKIVFSTRAVRLPASYAVKQPTK